MKACEAGGLDAVPTACNARICSVAAPFHQCLTHRLPGLQSRRKTEERVSPRRLDGSGWDLQRELEGTRAQSRLIVRTRECGRCSDGACLRARLALIFGKAKRCRCERLSGGATHLSTCRLHVHVHVPSFFMWVVAHQPRAPPADGTSTSQVR